MYISIEDKLSETALGEAVLSLLKEQKTISFSALYQRLRIQLVEDSDEQRREGVITALWEIKAVIESTPLKQDVSSENQDIYKDNSATKH